MMIKAKPLTGGVLSLVTCAFKNAVAGGVVLLAVLFSGAAMADEAQKDVYRFTNAQSVEASLSYEIVRKIMPETIARAKDGEVNPVISITEDDLNGDDNPEIIANYLPDWSLVTLVCDKKGNCPYYVFQTRGEVVHTLAVIQARSLARGPKIESGYWTLKAYPDESDNFVLYTYDKAKDQYVQAPQSTPK